MARGVLALYVTEPYFGEAGNISMVSLTTPVYDAATNFVGVAGADLALGLDSGSSVRNGSAGPKSAHGSTSDYACLISRGGEDHRASERGIDAPQGDGGAEITSQPGGQMVAAAREGLLFSSRSNSNCRESRLPLRCPVD